MSDIKEEIFEEVRRRSELLGGLPEIRTVAIALGYSFVELENDRMGVCFTGRSSSPSCNHYQQAGSLRKKGVLELAGLMFSEHPLERSIGISAVTVISQMIMDEEPERHTFAKVDFLDLVPQGAKVGMVGFIRPFVPVLLKRSSSLIVVDDNPQLQPGTRDDGCVISRRIEDIADSDALVVTGSCVAVGGFDQVIKNAHAAKFIGIVGPSAGWLPEPAFKRGVNAVAATKITDIVGARHVILEGGGAPDFMKYGRKYTLINP